MSHNANINLNLDAFARLRISNPETIFDSKQIFDKQALFYDEATSGTGSETVYNANQASTTLTSGSADLSHAIRQTFQFFNYQPGKSQLIIMTGIIGEAEQGFTQRIGIFNDHDGLFFEVTENGLGVVVRTSTSGSPVDTRIDQGSFNSDRLNKTIRSTTDIDLDKTQIFFIDFEWLGVGTIRFGVFINGSPVICHEIHNANINPLVYMSTPNLPLRYEVRADGTGTGTKSMLHICSSVITEGGRSKTGTLRGLNRANNTLVTNNDLLIYPLIGIRFQANKFGALINLLNLEIICSSTAEYAWYLILSPTITGTAPTWNPIDNSTLEFAYPSNATTASGGTILYTGLGSDGNQIKLGAVGNLDNDLNVGSTIAGASQEIFIAVQRLTGGTETFYSSLNFSETI